MQWRGALGLTLVVMVLAGCATTQTSAGSDALREGRPEAAAEHFKEALADDPSRVDAKIGLGISRYRLAAYDEAIAALGDAVKQAPEQPAARLYLGLSHLRKREDATAQEHLAGLRALPIDLRKREDATAQEHLAGLRALPIDPRLVAQVDQTLTLLRAGPVTDPIRTYIAASLDYGFDWFREVAETRLALRNAQLAWDPFWSRPYVLAPCRRC